MSQQFYNLPCSEFVQALSSKRPVPGGGGTSALVGALGTALGGMVCSLTAGKKAHENAQERIAVIQKKAALLQTELLMLIDADAEAFAPLAEAYGLPKDTEEARAHREDVMEEALERAASVPLAIMERCCESIDLLEELSHIGAPIALSDAGCGAAICRAALHSASLNVFINTKSMRDSAQAERINARANVMLGHYIPVCDAILTRIANGLMR